MHKKIHKSINSRYYNNNYYVSHDNLDLHIAESIKILMQENGYLTALDVGCGTGRLVQFLNNNGFQAYGCDLFPNALKMARKINKKGTIKKASAIKLPFKDKSFSFVCAISVIEHLTKSQAHQFLKEARRLLKVNGMLFLITPNFNSPFRYIKGKKWFAFSDPTHTVFYTPASIKHLLTIHNFYNPNFRFKINWKVTFDWHLPLFLRKLPQPIKYAISYLLISSPLATFRDSFWVACNKRS